MDGCTLLDARCGTGNYLIEALNKGASFVTGFESSLSLILEARQRLNHGANKGRYVLLQEEVGDIIVFEHDYAVAIDIMEHTDQPLEVLKRLYNAVQISAFVSFPVKYRLSSLIRRVLHYFSPCIFNTFSRKEIIEMGYSAGFREIKILDVQHPGIDYLAVFRK
ncbi:MAG: class I SAM-dependent methyltransferase [Syntrophothermus sp.]